MATRQRRLISPAVTSIFCRSKLVITRPYMDAPVLIGHGQTISQPFIVALMTHLAALNFDDTAMDGGGMSWPSPGNLRRSWRRTWSDTADWLALMRIAPWRGCGRLQQLEPCPKR